MLFGTTDTTSSVGAITTLTAPAVSGAVAFAGEALEDRVGVDRDLLVGCCLEDVLVSLCDLLLESY